MISSLMRTAALATATFLLANPLGQTIFADDLVIKIETDTQTTNEKDGDDQSIVAAMDNDHPSIDVAILLDTSSSMDGLINQARSQLWNVVEQFSKAQKAGKTSLLRVAVFEYGNSNLPATEDYIRQVVALTDDLDKVSEGLFALTTDGGDEYCGSVIKAALKRLDWSTEPGAYKAIFIAGNETFDQGSVNYAKMCKKAIRQNVVVNTIHCGNRQSGIRGHWKDGADLAEGKFMNIDQDQRVVHIKAPQDDIIIRLNSELNKTYLWYGARQTRSSYQSNQAMQDSNASKFGGLAQRATVKSGAAYRNVGRDLVDTYQNDKTSLAKIDRSELPDQLQNLSDQELVAEIERIAKRREEIKTELAELAQERETYLQIERRKIAAPSANSFGDALSKAASEQLNHRGFQTE